MSEMVYVNIRLPIFLEKQIEKKSGETYLSSGEFVRSSVIKLLMKFGFLSQAALVNYLIKKSKTRGKFSEEEELKELRRIRQEVWAEKYG